MHRDLKCGAWGRAMYYAGPTLSSTRTHSLHVWPSACWWRALSVRLALSRANLSTARRSRWGSVPTNASAPLTLCKCTRCHLLAWYYTSSPILGHEAKLRAPKPFDYRQEHGSVELQVCCGWLNRIAEGGTCWLQARLREYEVVPPWCTAKCWVEYCGGAVGVWGESWVWCAWTGRRWCGQHTAAGQGCQRCTGGSWVQPTGRWVTPWLMWWFMKMTNLLKDTDCLHDQETTLRLHWPGRQWNFKKLPSGSV